MCIETESAENYRLDAKKNQTRRLVSAFCESISVWGRRLLRSSAGVYEPKRGGFLREEKCVDIEDGAWRSGLEG